MLTTRDVESELNMRNYFLGEAEPPPITVTPSVPPDTRPFFEKFGAIAIVSFALLVALAFFPEGESEASNETT